MRYGLLVLPLLVSACTSSPAKKPDHPQVGMFKKGLGQTPGRYLATLGEQ